MSVKVKNYRIAIVYIELGFNLIRIVCTKECFWKLKYVRYVSYTMCIIINVVGQKIFMVLTRQKNTIVKSV